MEQRPPDTPGMHELQIVDAAELAAAYAAAEYGVALDGDVFPLRVGALASDLEAYWPASRYVFITAWNPASEPHPDEANDSANALLAARLDSLGTSRQPAWAQDVDGDWKEPGWLVADLGQAQGDALAREFGQAAVLCWKPREPVRLRMLLGCRPPAAHHSGKWADFTDWVE